MKNSIKVERVIKNMTKQDFATAIGVSRNAIKSIESGKYVPFMVFAINLSALFGKLVNDIF